MDEATAVEKKALGEVQAPALALALLALALAPAPSFAATRTTFEWSVASLNHHDFKRYENDDFRDMAAFSTPRGAVGLTKLSTRWPYMAKNSVSTIMALKNAMSDTHVLRFDTHVAALGITAGRGVVCTAASTISSVSRSRGLLFDLSLRCARACGTGRR